MAIGFKNPKAPFLFVQLAPYNYGDKPPLLPKLWAAQSEVLEIPHTGMAIINDIGNPKDIHPTNKSDVGHRLALLALADSYGRKELVKSGPLFSGFEAKDGKVTATFKHHGTSLKQEMARPRIRSRLPASTKFSIPPKRSSKTIA